jgi:hypothetical protein
LFCKLHAFLVDVQDHDTDSLGSVDLAPYMTSQHFTNKNLSANITSKPSGNSSSKNVSLFLCCFLFYLMCEILSGFIPSWFLCYDDLHRAFLINDQFQMLGKMARPNKNIIFLAIGWVRMLYTSWKDFKTVIFSNSMQKLSLSIRAMQTALCWTNVSDFLNE